MQQLDEVIAKAQAEIEGVKDAAVLEELRVQYLGKKGFFTEQMKTLGRLSAEERPAAGARGDYRVQMRHGVSRVRAGRRMTLGLIFHDAA